jgi:NhaA family Na+:H+ antiporter
MARRLTLDFLKTEAASGLILGGAALLAIIAANSPWSDAYFGLLAYEVPLQMGQWRETHSVLDWIKEGLMAIFFFVVGLEIKYEVLRGELSNPRKLALPVLAALGGMIAPAVIYLSLNAGPGGATQGWAVPVATDIAFALAALAVVGRALPDSLRIFLLTLAIADDLGAVILIAVLFTSEIDASMLIGAAAGLIMLFCLRFIRRVPFFFYAVGFMIVWAFTLESGVSTSVAGVAAAMMIPIEPRRPGEEGVLKNFVDSLHGYVAYFILPLFAFAAAGFSMAGLSVREVTSPVTLGILLGLFLGKPIGVFGASLLAVWLKLAKRPTHATWLELFGVAWLCGVGFTMSLFIGGLAFPASDPVAQGEIRLGVILGTIVSILGGMAVLRVAAARRERRRMEDQAAYA